MEYKKSENSRWTNKNDIQYLGAYFNMARHNVYLLINHLTSVFSHLGFEELNDDEEIWSDKAEKNNSNILLQIFNPENPRFQDERIRVFNYIQRRHYLPCLRIFTNDFQVLEATGNRIKKDELAVDFAKMHEFLNLACKELNGFRNSYTHYLSINSKGKRLKKKRMISSKLVPVIKTLFHYAPEYSFLRHNIERADKDVKVYKKEVRQYYDDIKSKYSLFEGDSRALNREGLFFFVNLFLDRANGIKFLKRFRGFKNETAPPFKATIQAFTSYTLKVPDMRLDNDMPEQALMMEMLNELNKCPAELYKVLNQEDRDIFSPKLSEASFANILENTHYEDIDDAAIEQIIKENVVLRRREDRFPYFALRYLDIKNLLGNLRFQIYLGKIELSTYDKSDLNIERRVLVEVNGIGKLSDFEGKQEEILAKINMDIAAQGKEVRWDQFKPSYCIRMNKIGFYLFDENTEDSEKVIFPKCISNNEPERKVNLKINQTKPTGFLSTHALPKFLMTYFSGDNDSNAVSLINTFVKDINPNILDIDFINACKNEIQLDPEEMTKRRPRISALKEVESKIIIADGHAKTIEISTIHHVNHDMIKRLATKLEISESQLAQYNKDGLRKEFHDELSTKDIEVFSHFKYQKYMSDRRQNLDAIIKDYFPEISSRDIPKRIYDYILNINSQDSKKYIHEKIKAELDAAKQYVKDAERFLKYEEQPKLGELATILTKDIINMIVTEDVKKKITNPYFNRLQNLIAFYSLNKNEIEQLCTELNVLNYDKGHVFLNWSLIRKSTGVIDFFINYFKAKADWIKDTLLVDGKKGGYSIDNRIIPLKYQATIAKKAEFDFERWLIEKKEAPINLPIYIFDNYLNEVLNNSEANQNGDDMTLGFSQLVAQRVDHDQQKFYSFTRIYNVDGKEKSLKYGTHLSSKTMSLEYGKKVVENEKLIRFALTKDRIMKLMCQDILEKNGSVSSEYKFTLRDMSPDSEKNILNDKTEFEYQLRKNIDGSGAELFTIYAKDSEAQLQQIQKWKALDANMKREWLSMDTKEKQMQYLESKDEVTKLILQGQKGYQWTFSDFGRFKRFLKDRRIPQMVRYFNSPRISFDLLEFQLMQYNIYREKMFDKIFELERLMAKHYLDEIISLKLSDGTSHSEVGFNIYLKILDQKYGGQFDRNIVKWGRNRFAHSEVVWYDGMTKITNDQVEEFENIKMIKGYKEGIDYNIAKNIYLVYSREIDKVIELINTSLNV